MTASASDLDPSVILHKCWGKAATDVPGGWHPATLHMLDVAAVAMELLDERLPAALGVDLLRPAGKEIEANTLAAMVCLHDIGKLSPGFQQKVEDRWATLGLTRELGDEKDHGRSGVDAFSRWCRPREAGAPPPPRFSAAPSYFAGCAVAYHHGRFGLHEGKSVPTIWHRVQDLWRQQVSTIFGVDPLEELDHQVQVRPLKLDQWLVALAGFTTVADWVGSNTDFFPYEPATKPDGRYLEKSRLRAQKALDGLGWYRRSRQRAIRGFGELFAGFEPRSLQKTAIEVAAAAHCPGLVIIEAETGSGKTEASLAIVEDWAARFGVDGLYYALPTQATANQMFGRIRRFLEGSTSTRVGLQLLHGAGSFNKDQKELRFASVDPADGSGRGAATVVADQWFTARRRGLLSRYAVGTVDQAMMAAQQTKHFFVRQFGLARKVVVIDEVHAYDAFMSKILDRLLTWLSAMGTGVILLSATLTQETRERFLEAYGKVPDGEAPPTPLSEDYPRVTSLCGSQVGCKAIPRERASVSLSVEALQTSTAEIARQLVERTREGGVVAWICNTVSASQKAYSALDEAGLAKSERLLFHARMPFGDRAAREAEILEQLCKPSSTAGPGARNPRRPHRLVVVATQVVEQSLDIDFDGMVSELAPIDLLLQRAGRMHRHGSAHFRPPGFEAPVLHVRLPEGFPEEFGPSGYVYTPFILHRTATTLDQDPVWRIPEDVDRLLAAVYPNVPKRTTGDQIPEPRELWKELETERKKADQKARTHLVPPPNSSSAPVVIAATSAVDDEGGGRNVVAKTRDIDFSVRVICLERRGEHVVIPGARPTTLNLQKEVPFALVSRLLERSLTLSSSRIAREVAKLKPPRAFESHGALFGSVALVFGPDRRCEEVSEHGIDLNLILDPELGLMEGA